MQIHAKNIQILSTPHYGMPIHHQRLQFLFGILKTLQIEIKFSNYNVN